MKKLVAMLLIMFLAGCGPDDQNGGSSGVPVGKPAAKQSGGQAEQGGQQEALSVAVIPQPVMVEVGEGVFVIDGKTYIVAKGDTQGVGEYLSALLDPATDLKLEVKSGDAGGNAIVLDSSGSAEKYGKEGYALEVKDDGVVITAASAHGVFNGCQTLRQLLPTEIESKTKVAGISWSVPKVKIEDEPRYPWRGMHLDVCRHFFDKEFVKKYIDMLAMHKMNVFHWHLTEDQGWRVAIDKYPKLTEISAWRAGEYGKKYPEGETYGGFYTKDEIREVVAYAAERFVTVVPEIEMPGHSVAVLAAHPELSCTGGPFIVYENWGVSKDVFCAGKEETFEFLENVLAEVVELFPGEFFHIGGDECPKDRWKKCELCQARIKAEGLHDEHELQSYFVQRIEKFLNSKGKRLIGWDEILEGGLAPNAAVMSWRGMSGGIAAASQGHDVVMSPTSHCYFDFYQGDPKTEPKAIGGFLPLEKVYSFEPTPENLPEDKKKHMLGAQGNVWTEYIPTTQQVEYMAAPRMSALAEVVWSPKELRDWDDFQQRLGHHLLRLDGMEVNYRLPNPSGLQSNNVFLDTMTVEMASSIPDSEVRYTTDGSEPTAESKLYTGAITVTEDGEIKAVTVLSSGRVSAVSRGVFKKAVMKQAVQVEGLQGGLKYRYFEKGYQRLPDFSQLQAAKEGVMKTVGLPEEHKGNDFSVDFAGYVKIEKAGIYSFATRSDDGSKLYIGDELVVDNDGPHAPQVRVGQAALAAGYHPIRVEYCELTGDEVLEAFWQVQGQDREPIPAGSLFHK
ncbi:MAG: family 20 glycosylhydrolase [Sedimentisphaerales bacterium]|nr:family 20 glycosylhydrolase [Sedimentisphaerales bacterium]